MTNAATLGEQPDPANSRPAEPAAVAEARQVIAALVQLMVLAMLAATLRALGIRIRSRRKAAGQAEPAASPPLRRTSHRRPRRPRRAWRTIDQAVFIKAFAEISHGLGLSPPITQTAARSATPAPQSAKPEPSAPTTPYPARAAAAPVVPPPSAPIPAFARRPSQRIPRPPPPQKTRSGQPAHARPARCDIEPTSRKHSLQRRTLGGLLPLNSGEWP